MFLARRENINKWGQGRLLKDWLPLSPLRGKLR